MDKLLVKLKILFFTVIHLKIQQVARRVQLYFKNQIYEYLPKKRVNFSYKTLYLKIHSFGTSVIPPEIDRALSNKYLFSSIYKRWNADQLGLLEKYHLHYFNFINQGKTSLIKTEESINLIIDWIHKNPIGKGCGWDPYPLSLRLGNEILFFIKHYNNLLKDEARYKMLLGHLYQQASSLYGRFEYHLMANHLLENARAMVMAGLFFGVDKWYRKGRRVLLKELDEQFKTDGGHYEKSLLYQNILLKHLLDLYSVVKNLKPPGIFSSDETIQKRLDQKIPQIYFFLHSMVGALKEPPLWGDSSPDMMYAYPDLERIFKYWFPKKDTSEKIGMIFHSESGFTVSRDKQTHFIFKTGCFGPDYQPGHSHCDVLSFTLHVDGQPFFIDPGLGNYRNSETRHYARSIWAHNTVVVNELSQAECWHAFRMGRRIKCDKPKISHNNNETAISGSYYHQWAPRSKRYRHTREIKFMKKGWGITDSIDGNSITSINTRFHLHPRIQITKKDDRLELYDGKNILYFIYGKANVQLSILNGRYFSGYDKFTENKVLNISIKIARKIKMSYVICLPDGYDEAKTYLASFENGQSIII